MKKKGRIKKLADFSKAVFDGFVLKKGYLYGVDNRGNPVATSTCMKDGNLAIYTKELNEWVLNWVPLDKVRKDYPQLYKMIILQQTKEDN